MALVDSESDNELMRLWSLITELSEELNRNRHLAVSLYTETGKIKNQAVHSQTGFVLRRFNLDKSSEEYSAELERMNKTMSAENHVLAHDNKQLNALIKEYEQGLEAVMSDFRNRAQDVQTRELSLIRHYETQLLAKEEEYSFKELTRSTAISESLSRISTALRNTLRNMAGEEPNEDSGSDSEPEAIDQEEGSSSSPKSRSPQPQRKVTFDKETFEREPWMDPAAQKAEEALEREIELARLERENEELRRLYGLPVETYQLPPLDTLYRDKGKEKERRRESGESEGSDGDWKFTWSGDGDNEGSYGTIKQSMANGLG